MKRRTYVVVGTGGRVTLFLDALADQYRSEGELLALCDVSQTAMNYHQKRLKRDFGYGAVKTYPADQFSRMLEELRPDVVLVCTPDGFHHEYIIGAVNGGCDVVCEKPITVDDAKCREILSAPGIATQNVRITFNVRWSPLATMVKEMILAGKIGAVKQVQYEAMLDWRHGGSYFSRWHSEKAKSGGLLVHKSTHHFDLVNWWLNSIPQEVFSFGGLTFYGRENAIRRGQEAWTKHKRYTGEAPKDDPFYIDLTSNDAGVNLYMAAEEETGYIYDRNVFRDGIDIEDSLSLVARYRNGAVLNYSLNAFSPCSGYRVSITGDGGRLEYLQVIRPPEMMAGSEVMKRGGQQLTYLPLFGKGEVIDVPEIEGDHFGGDPRIQEQIFSLNPPADPFGRSAGHEQGIASAMIGIAANRSMAQGRSVKVDDLVCLRPEAQFLDELK